MIVGIDSGGTFTDIVVIANGKLEYFKVASTPTRPAQALVNAIEQIRARFGNQIDAIVHGTTIATNALLERKGARLAFVTNAGFEDVLQIGRQNRDELYNLNPKPRKSLVSRDMIFGLKQRTNADGLELAVPEIEELTELVDWLQNLNPETVAIGLLHAPTNSEPEESIALLLNELGIPCCYSSEVDPVPCEYERFSTVTANAFLLPIVGSYMRDIQQSINTSNILIQQSNGGLSPTEFAARMPIRLLLSGPAGGVSALEVIAKLHGIPKLIGFDMGGTSTDVSLYDNGLQYRDSIEINSIPVRMPTIDIHTVGSGGGSIAWIDSGLALKVGPQSSGASPGPACYKKGGPFCTTDANLLLGRIDKKTIFPEIGELSYEHSLATAEPLANSLKMSPIEFAQGVVSIANVIMSRAIRKISQEQGKDPADYTLVAFGGAGGLHACELAELLGIKRVLVPFRAGVFSALGMALSAPKLDFMKHCGKYCYLEQELNPDIKEDINSAVEFSREKANEYGIGIENTIIKVKCKYPQQMFTLELEWSDRIAADFSNQHKAKYGFTLDSMPVEIVTIQVSVIGKTPELSIPKCSTQRVVCRNGSYFEWESLTAGHIVSGEAIVAQNGATAYIPNGWTGLIDEYQNLAVEVKNAV